MDWLKRICTIGLLAIAFQIFLNGEIQIAESVTEFRYPKFSEKGFIEWVLEGNSGTYDQSDISIDGLKLRIYSGDQLARSLSNITGDNCMFDSDSQIATSDDSILIKGSGFDLSGREWTYDLSKEIIALNADALVRFSQNIDSIFSGVEQSGETTIKSNRMRLIIEPTRYLFRFEGNCTLSSESFVLESETLELELLNNSKKVSFSIPTGELSGMKSIVGEGDVQFTGMGQFIQSDNFSIQPQENKAIFEGKALIRYNQIELKGDYIDWKQDLVQVLSLNNHLSSFSHSIDNQLYSDEEKLSTFVQSRNISFLKQEDVYEYIFSDDVFFVSEFYRINAEWLYLKTNEVPDLDSSKMFQDIILTEAKENVIVKHENYQISGENLRYLPRENELELSNKVIYISEFAQMKSDHLYIENDTLFASSDQEFIEVVLPNTTDLNFEFNEIPDSPKISANNDTIVYANDLKIDILDSVYHCLFSGSVSLINNDFSMASDYLTMKWEPADIGNTTHTEYTIDAMIAEGTVKMEQINYYASANHVEILPDEKKFYLMGNAHFKDGNGSLWGEHIEFDRKTKQTRVTGSNNGERARIQFDIFGTEEENLEESEKE